MTFVTLLNERRCAWLGGNGGSASHPLIYEVKSGCPVNWTTQGVLLKKKEWGIVMDNDRINKMLNSIPRKTREEFLLILRDLLKSEVSSEPSRESQERAQLKA